MRALVCEVFGARPVVREVDVPAVRPGFVLVRTQHSSVCAGDLLMVNGRPWLFRPVFTAMLGRPAVLGRDMAGVVEAVGDGVEGLSVGDSVIGEAGGAWAEQVLVPADACARVPAGVDLREAGTLPVSGLTALQGIRDAGRVQEGSRVLVVGASGGVGHFAVQIATALGARVTGVCSAAKAERVRELGAVDVIDHTRERFVDRRGAFDAVLDLSGAEPIGACLQTLAPGGVYVSSAGSNGGWLAGPLPRLLAAALRSLVDRSVVVLTTQANRADLTTLVQSLAEGRLRPWIGTDTHLAGLPTVLEHYGSHQGKIAVDLR
ncbi:MAG: NAD(P)-dependent alcohol dehydrogenase [Myxococcota bacterium]